MLKANLLKQKLTQGQQVFGLFCSIPSPVAVELIGEADYDFVIIDMEHVLLNPETLENMIRAADALGLTALVRVPDDDSKTILRVLDAGAHGIVIPNVEDADSLHRIVRASKYHPDGERSLNGGRAGAFGKHSLVEYMAFANQETLIVPMIESLRGVSAIAELLAVDGVDMVLEGAADLSQSCGVPWQISTPVVQEALVKVQQACQQAGVPYCAIPRADGEFERWQARGVHSFVLGDERGIAFRALQARRNSLIKN